MGVRATTRAPSDRIAVIAIDDTSIANIGRWPWSRDVHARMTDEPGRRQGQGHRQHWCSSPSRSSTPASPTSPSSPASTGSSRRDPAAVEQGSPLAQMGALLKEAEAALNTDRKLAESYAKAGNVLLPMLFDARRAARQAGPAAARLRHAATRSRTSRRTRRDLPFADGRATCIVPIDLLGRATAGLGHLNARVDVDGGDPHRAAGAALFRPALSRRCRC